jgi:hypothetical protein
MFTLDAPDGSPNTSVETPQQDFTTDETSDTRSRHIDFRNLLPSIPSLEVVEEEAPSVLLIADAVKAAPPRLESSPVARRTPLAPIEVLEIAEIVVSQPTLSVVQKPMAPALAVPVAMDVTPQVAEQIRAWSAGRALDTAAPESSRRRRTVEPTEWSEPPVRISRQMAALKPRVDNVLRFYRGRPLNTVDDSAWSIMHSFLGYGLDAPLAVGNARGRRTNAVTWMCANNPCAGRSLLYLNQGSIKGIQGPGFEGHPGQFLAMLAQIGVSKDHPLRVQGQDFTVEDLLRSEQLGCAANVELTFKLIATSHYLESDAQWTNDRGEVWDIPKLLRIELSQPVNGAACGGTHRIMACSYALRMRRLNGKPIDGAYATAEKYVRDYQRYAFSLQNRDGSFSSDWFKRRTSWGDENRQLQTTGHILEWLVFSLPHDELSDPRIVRSVDFLSGLMWRHRYLDWEVGPRGHALRALSLYQQRVFEERSQAAPLASRPVSARD